MNIIKWLTKWFMVKDHQEVFYIQGSEALPQPLSKEEEQLMLLKLQEGDMDARNILIEHNLRLVVFIAKRYETNPIHMEDLISIGTIGLVKAINTFKSDKNIKLVTYASRCIENEILMHFRKKSKRKNEVSFDEPLNVDSDGNELLLSDILGTSEDTVEKAVALKDDKERLMLALNELNDQEQMILKMRYGLNQEEYTQKDIAKSLGISQSYISRLEKKIIEKLKLAFLCK